MTIPAATSPRRCAPPTARDAIAQIETVAGVENCDAIAAVDGIDCLWVGHFDLTQSMGIPAQFDNPAFIDNITRVAQACEAHGKAAAVRSPTSKPPSFGKTSATGHLRTTGI